MATLTSVAYYTRKSVIYGSAGFVFFLILRLAWGVFSAWWIKNHYSPPPPTVAFGVLPAIKFPDGKDPKQISLKLETITGVIPNLGSQAKVYFMPSYRANILGLELTAGLAAKLGFLFAPTRVDEQVYKWTREGSLPGTLSANLVTSHFRLTTSWRRDATIVSARFPSEVEAIKAAKRFLNSVNLLDNDLDTGAVKVEYLQADAGYSPAVSQSEANFARVHLFRAPIENISVVTPNPNEGLVQVIVSGASGQKQIVEADYNYFSVEYSRFATYPLITTKTAWEILVAGQGYIPKLILTQGQTAVRHIKLAYFDSSAPQEFLQPIYVFEGDNGFLGIVPALDPRWLGQK
jgi:hypothetical protein